jgi:ABC-type polysaccharide/polyol phosphate transport system ATPase subunit
MTQIDLSNVTVAYPVSISGIQRSGFAAAANAMSFGRIGQDSVGVQYVVALDSLNLNIRPGTRLGLIGRNGSGKSTLLRTIAGIVPPRYGNRRVEGEISCMLSLGAGMDPEKSGIDNMRLIARLHGLHGPALERAVNEAAEFTELGPYLALPVRTYSAGMIARLSFAIATAKPSDILVIDEIIGAGDAHFIGKAGERILSLSKQANILVLASHSHSILQSYCNEVLWMDAGRVRMRGPVDEVWNAYMTEMG